MLLAYIQFTTILIIDNKTNLFRRIKTQININLYYTAKTQILEHIVTKTIATAIDKPNTINWINKATDNNNNVLSTVKLDKIIINVDSYLDLQSKPLHTLNITAITNI